MTAKIPRGAKKTAPRLKNYSSNSSESAIFEAIRTTLAAHKARRISYDQDGNGRAIAIEFTVEIGANNFAFRLPARFDRAEPLVAKARKTAHVTRLSGDALQDQAYRTTWATIRDWVDAQMALIDIGASSVEEVFLPYLLVEGNKTFYEVFAEQRALPSPRAIITEE